MPLLIDLSTKDRRNEAVAMAKLAGAGTFIKYYEGFLALDADDKTTDTWQDAAITGDQFYRLYLEGYVELFQRKIKDGCYEYLAQVMSEIGRSARALRNYSLYTACRSIDKQYISAKPVSSVDVKRNNDKLFPVRRGRPPLSASVA